MKWIVVGSLIIVSGFGTAYVVDRLSQEQSTSIGQMSQHPLIVTPQRVVGFYDITTRQPMLESLAHLQFLADGVRCPVSDRSSIMASCVIERYQKMRDKALSARARYDALVGLERAYWAALAREGLTQQVEHVPSKAGR